MVDLLRRVEEALERVIDGGLARLSGVSVHPLEIARRLENRMRDGKLIGTEVPYVPNRYVARLHDGDLEALGGVVADVADQIARSLEEHAAEQGWAFGGGIEVLIEGGGAKKGRIEVEHSFDESPPPARLVMVEGEPAGAVYEIGQRATIGRDPDCEAVVLDPAASRRHATLEWTYTGYLLRDLGSRNGTWVNGEPVQQTTLSGGDVVQVGSAQLRVEIG